MIAPSLSDEYLRANAYAREMMSFIQKVNERDEALDPTLREIEEPDYAAGEEELTAIIMQYTLAF